MATGIDPQTEAVDVAESARSDCRACGAPLEQTLVDLGSSPLANTYLTADELGQPELFYPLRVYVCERCFLVQLPPLVTPEELFSDYAYLSSYSESWLRHARDYVQSVTTRFGIDSGSHVVEIASNDGYLLQYFKEGGIPILGIEPARNVAQAAESAGIPTLVRFFGRTVAHELAAAGKSADLLIGNNVLAHVPELKDFVEGIRALLLPSGIATLEFPHLMRLIEKTEFDTIYHEHFSYFSLAAAERLFAQHGLTIFDVDELATHGGSLRIYACHTAAGRPIEPAVGELRERERQAGLERADTYSAFAERVGRVKRSLLEFLLSAKRDGKTVVGYGAPAKGNTLLNYCGVRGDFIDYVVDRNPHKQGLFLPGTHIPIHEPDRIAETRPNYLLILPWNLREEIIEQMNHVRDFGCRFVVPIPETTVLA